MYELVKQHVLSLLNRGELMSSSKPKKEAPNNPEDAPRILEELVSEGATVHEQPIRDSVPQGHTFFSTRDSRLQIDPPPHPLNPSKPAEGTPRVFIRSRL